MENKKELNQEQLEKVSGGVKPDNSLDPSFNKIIPAIVLKTLPKGTRVLVSYGPGKTQFLGPLVNLAKMTSSERSYVIEVRCEKTTNDVKAYIGGVAGANVCDVTVYKQ